jgi:predicted GNAT family acetyltransferase
LLRWWRAFIDEALPDEAFAHEVAENRVDQRLDPQRKQGIDVWVVDEEVVAMSAYSIPVANSIRIGPVYTPLERRGNGYGSALVHTQSSAMLEAGRTWCLLYTDLANPTSNRIYERIGYQQVAESAAYEF